MALEARDNTTAFVELQHAASLVSFFAVGVGFSGWCQAGSATVHHTPQQPLHNSPLLSPQTKSYFVPSAHNTLCVAYRYTHAP